MDSKRVNHLNKSALVVLALLLALNIGVIGYLMGAKAFVESSQVTVTEQSTTDDASDTLEQTKYVLYIGTNDKDTYQQEIPYDQCVQKVTEICTRYVGGCTLSEANGYWTDDSGEITKEQSIECVLEDVTEDQVHQIADEVLKELNQNSILIETQGVTSEFYAG